MLRHREAAGHGSESCVFWLFWFSLWFLIAFALTSLVVLVSGLPVLRHREAAARAAPAAAVVEPPQEFIRSVFIISNRKISK